MQQHDQKAHNTLWH